MTVRDLVKALVNWHDQNMEVYCYDDQGELRPILDLSAWMEPVPESRPTGDDIPRYGQPRRMILYVDWREHSPEEGP